MKIFSVKDKRPILKGRYLIWFKGESEPQLADYEIYADEPVWNIDGAHGDWDDEVTHYAYMPKRPRIGKSGEV